MAIKKYISGAWQDIENLKKYSGNTWEDCESAYKYENGAWVEVWPNCLIGNVETPYSTYATLKSGAGTSYGDTCNASGDDSISGRFNSRYWTNDSTARTISIIIESEENIISVTAHYTKSGTISNINLDTGYGAWNTAFVYAHAFGYDSNSSYVSSKTYFIPHLGQVQNYSADISATFDESKGAKKVIIKVFYNSSGAVCPSGNYVDWSLSNLKVNGKKVIINPYTFS